MHEEPLILTAGPRGFLERLEPRVKLVCVVAWAVCVVTLPAGRWHLSGVYALMLALLLAANHRLAGSFARRCLPALPALVLLCVLLPVLKRGEPLWNLGVLCVTREGLDAGLRLGSVAGLCLAAVALLWASTPEPVLLRGLRGVGLPRVFVGILGSMLRYLEVLRPELHRLTDARAARTIGAGGPGRLRSGANVIGTLFLRAHERAERVADAMAARGYTGRLRSLRTAHFHARDVFAGLLFLTIVIGLRFLIRS